MTERPPKRPIRTSKTTVKTPSTRPLPAVPAKTPSAAPTSPLDDAIVVGRRTDAAPTPAPQYIHEFDGNWTPELEQAVMERWIATFEEEAEEAEGPAQAPLETLLTPELVGAFLVGERTLADLMGMTQQEAFGIAQFAHNYLVAGRYKEAETLFEALVLWVPHEPYFHTCLGAVYQKKGMTKEAIEEYSVALSHNPLALDALVNRGELLLLDGRLQDAFADLRAAVENHPENSPLVARARAIVTLAAHALQETGGTQR